MTDDKDEKSPESLIEFPCDFMIKVFGLANDEFDAAVLMIMNKQVSHFSDRAIQTRPSANGKYRAFTITVHVDTKAELDAIYQALSASPHVLMAL